jgi:hypothetical protein
MAKANETCRGEHVRWTSTARSELRSSSGGSRFRPGITVSKSMDHDRGACAHATPLRAAEAVAAIRALRSTRGAHARWRRNGARARRQLRRL